MHVAIIYGALSSISKQIKKQGLKFDAEDVEFFQQLSDAITLLSIKGCITSSQTEAARKKLHKKILSYLKSKNK